jgi:putative ABC transport system permease protein
VRQDGLDAGVEPTMYAPYAQAPTPSLTVLVRSTRDPLALVPEVRDVMAQIDRGIPPYRFASMAEVVSDSVADRRFPLLVLSLFAFVALFLAGVGLYGVLSYTVTQRTQEIGVRMAIGAAPPQVRRLVVGHGLRLTLAGMALGFAGALALSQLVTAMLFDVAPFDPISYVATAAGLLAVASLASYLPARRATRVDPLTALRAE